MSISELNLDGKGVLVTGAGTGIGREIGLEFARHGANVAFHYNRSADGALSAAEEAKSHAVRAIALGADLSNLEHLGKLAQSAEQGLGQIDVLVNNSGITFNKPFFEMEPYQFQKIYDVNVRAGFFLSQYLARKMASRGRGAICNLTSIHGMQGASEHAGYAGTKGAIIAHTRALGVELAPYGVRVNAIAPGWVDVENHVGAVENYDESKRWAADKIPVGRHGVPLDVARLAVFLCSDAGSFIVGQTFVVDGGTTALMSLFPDFRSASRARHGQGYIPKDSPGR